MKNTRHEHQPIAECADPWQAVDDMKCPAEFDVYARLFAWLRANAGEIGSIAVAQDGNSRGLVANTDIARGSRILYVPANLFVTLHAAKRARAGVALEPIASCLNARSILATHLIFSRRAINNGHAYLDVLPPSFDTHPVICSEQSFAALANTGASQYAAAIRETIDEDYRRIADHLSPEERFDRSEFGWAFCNVLTRCFLRTTDPGGMNLVMVPVLDLTNHSAQPNCTGHFSSEGHHLEALTDIVRGEELTISYGANGNDKLLALWGFCLDENPEKRAWLSAPAITDELVSFVVASGRRSDRLQIRAAHLAPGYAAPEVQAFFGFLRCRQTHPFESDWPKAECAHSYLQPASRINEIGALRDFLAACDARAALIRANVASTPDQHLARMAALAVQDELEALSGFRRMAEFAIKVLETDDAELAWAALLGIADDAYVTALRSSWGKLWPTFDASGPRGARSA